MSKEEVAPLPQDAPRAGEVYRHYKNKNYRVLMMAMHTNDLEWLVIYEPLYENLVSKWFARPLQEWREVVAWEGEQVERFRKVEE